MKKVVVHKKGNSDSIPKANTKTALSGVGTGGGKAKVDTTHYLKDNSHGGALPDTQEELDCAADSKHYQNEKAMEGSLSLVRGFPQINAGDKITVLGVGQVFSGDWIVKTHSLKISSAGCQSTLELTRNAVGNAGVKPVAGNKIDTDKKKTVSKPLSDKSYKLTKPLKPSIKSPTKIA